MRSIEYNECNNAGMSKYISGFSYVKFSSLYTYYANITFTDIVYPHRLQTVCNINAAKLS